MSSTLAILHEAAVDLKKRVIAGRAELDQGICSNIRRSIAADRFAVKKLMNDLFEVWPEWTGSVTYPVPHPSGDCEYYLKTYDMWTGEYGAARMRLLDFIIEQTAPE